jgi:hypothetical protein
VGDKGNDMPLPLLARIGGCQAYPDGRGNRVRMDDRKPAERDDAEKELRRLARGRGVEPEFGRDGRERFLTGGEWRRGFVR